MITKQEALTTSCVHVHDGTKCRRWRRNGATQTWKRSPARFRLPVKYGLYSYDAVTEADCARSDIHTEESCPFV